MPWLNHTGTRPTLEGTKLFPKLSEGIQEGIAATPIPGYPVKYFYGRNSHNILNAEIFLLIAERLFVKQQMWFIQVQGHDSPTHFRWTVHHLDNSNIIFHWQSTLTNQAASINFYQLFTPAWVWRLHWGYTSNRAQHKTEGIVVVFFQVWISLIYFFQQLMRYQLI